LDFRADPHVLLSPSGEFPLFQFARKPPKPPQNDSFHNFSKFNAIFKAINSNKHTQFQRLDFQPLHVFLSCSNTDKNDSFFGSTYTHLGVKLGKKLLPRRKPMVVISSYSKRISGTGTSFFNSGSAKGEKKKKAKQRRRKCKMVSEKWSARKYRELVFSLVVRFIANECAAIF